MNGYRKDERRWCHFHPGEFVIGICALCLNEKLLILVSKQDTDHRRRQTPTNFCAKPKTSPAAKLTKLFALATLLNLVEVRKQKMDPYCRSSSTSPEDSFISIKFEDNGVASWVKGGEIPKMPLDPQCKMSSNGNGNEGKKVKSVMEHAKPRVALRWRRRIGQIFELIGLKKPAKGNMCATRAQRLERAKVDESCYMGPR